MKRIQTIDTPEEYTEIYEVGDFLWFSTHKIVVDGIPGQRRRGPTATVMGRMMMETFADESTAGGTSRMSFERRTFCEKCWIAHGVINCWNQGMHKPVEREAYL